MTSIPAPILIAFAALILWPSAQIAALVLRRKRLYALAKDLWELRAH